MLTCDENGFAQTKDMPYGIYTVRQTSGWEGRELMKDFDVFISKDGQTYRYLINNANFESYIKIVKKDAETGNTIPYAGAGFQIYDPNGNLVTMTFTYPEVTTIDTFYTTADGDLITPQTLEYGKGYSLVEVQAPYGYVLNSEPVYFDVVQENSEEESGITVIEVVRSNMAQKGTITVEKSGEVFSSVAGDKGLYQPIFSVSGLEGAVYEITAAEDIVTLDGTVRANKGEVVDTVTTGKDGTVKSKELYLGKYEVKEITAPYGMVLNEEVHSVELVYAGQNVDVTETATSFYNERQHVEIDLIKSLAIDEAYGIGKNGEIFDVTFGLYAAEELTAADGKTIPADGLIEVISLDESGHGKAISDLPMGSYYVQEISTNSAYIVSDAKYPVTFEYAGQDTETVRITANEDEAITNDIIYGSVSGKKSDEDGKALGGAVIGIFTTGTTEFTKENAIAATTSKDDGSFSFAKVPYGTWIIREIESPKGYVLSEEEIAVTIGKVDEVVEIELVNNFIKGNIALTKVDEDYPDNKLSGAVFEVYSDTNGDGKLDKDDTLLGEGWEDELLPDGKVIVNSVRSFGDPRIVAIDANGISQEILGRPIPNTALLGALCSVCDYVSADDVKRAIEVYMPAKLHEKNKRVVDAALETVGKTRAAGVAVKIDESPEFQVIGSVSRETAKDAHFDAPASRGEALIPTLQTAALDPVDFAHTTCYDGGYLVAKNAGWRNVRPVLDAGKCTGCLQCYLYCPDGCIFRPARQTADAAGTAAVAIDYDFCKGCGVCVEVCRFGALAMVPESEGDER